MWLSRPVYEGLPFLSMGLGLALLAAAFYIPYRPWPYACAVLGLVLLVTGLVLLLKRSGYRASRSRSRFDQAL